MNITVLARNSHLSQWAGHCKGLEIDPWVDFLKLKSLDQEKCQLHDFFT